MFLLREGQKGEIWEPSKKQRFIGNRGALDRHVLPHKNTIKVSNYISFAKFEKLQITNRIRTRKARTKSELRFNSCCYRTGRNSTD